MEQGGLFSSNMRKHKETIGSLIQNTFLFPYKKE